MTYYEIYLRSRKGVGSEGYLVDEISGEFLYKTKVINDRHKGANITPCQTYMQSKGMGTK